MTKSKGIPKKRKSAGETKAMDATTSSEGNAEDPLSGVQESMLVECKEEIVEPDEFDDSSISQQSTSFETNEATKRPRMQNCTNVKEQGILLNPEQVCVKVERDRFDVLAEHIADKMRHLSSRFAQDTVERLISGVMYDASLGKFDHPEAN